MILMNTQAVKQAGGSLNQLSSEVQNMRTIIKEVEHKIKSRVGLDEEEVRSVPEALKNLRTMVFKVRKDLTDRGAVISSIYEGVQQQSGAHSRLRSSKDY